MLAEHAPFAVVPDTQHQGKHDFLLTRAVAQIHAAGGGNEACAALHFGNVEMNGRVNRRCARIAAFAEKRHVLFVIERQHVAVRLDDKDLQIRLVAARQFVQTVMAACIAQSADGVHQILVQGHFLLLLWCENRIIGGFLLTINPSIYKTLLLKSQQFFHLYSLIENDHISNETILGKI